MEGKAIASSSKRNSKRFPILNTKGNENADEVIDLVNNSNTETECEETQPPPGYFDMVDAVRESPKKKTKKAEETSSSEGSKNTNDSPSTKTTRVARLLSERQPDETTEERLERDVVQRDVVQRDVVQRDVVNRDAVEANPAEANGSGLTTSTWYEGRPGGSFDLRVNKFPRGDYDVFSVIQEDLRNRIKHERFEHKMTQVKELFALSELYLGISKRNEAVKIYEKIHAILFGLLKTYGE